MCVPLCGCRVPIVVFRDTAKLLNQLILIPSTWPAHGRNPRDVNMETGYVLFLRFAKRLSIALSLSLECVWVGGWYRFPYFPLVKHLPR